MNSTDILVPKEKAVIINGVRHILKPLSFSQTLKLVRFLFSLREDIALSVSDSQTFMLEAFEAAGPKMPELMGILTGLAPFEPSMEEASEIMLALSELNDFAKIFANFQKAAEIIKKAMPKAWTESPSPSAK